MSTLLFIYPNYRQIKESRDTRNSVHSPCTEIYGDLGSKTLRAESCSHVEIPKEFSISFVTLTEEFPSFLTWYIVPAKVNLVRDHGAMLDVVEIIGSSAFPKLRGFQLLPG